MLAAKIAMFYLYITVTGDVEFVVDGGKFEDREICEVMGGSIAESMREEIADGPIEGAETIEITYRCSEAPDLSA